ncbi:MAG TPA: phosphotransferase [Streptosporangiaceae bacterium]|nr:phosphotransferase [Streptosporangiaceae bacterium]
MTGKREPAGSGLAGRSAAHGFCDDEATRRLLRSRPPRQALAWAAACLGGPVISARALRGGMSSAVHLLTVADGAGRRRPAVLRRYVRPELNAEEPDIAEREARALRAAEIVSVPTPTLLAVDPAGTQAGVPAVLMSRLPGRVDWWPSDTGRWLRRLAEVLPAIHAAPQPPARLIGPFSPSLPASYQPPPWARYPRVWERAADISRGPVPVVTGGADVAEDQLQAAADGGVLSVRAWVGVVTVGQPQIGHPFGRCIDLAGDGHGPAQQPQVQGGLAAVHADLEHVVLFRHHFPFADRVGAVAPVLPLGRAGRRWAG